MLDYFSFLSFACTAYVSLAIHLEIVLKIFVTVYADCRT